jgi:hypothetical protein
MRLETAGDRPEGPHHFRLTAGETEFRIDSLAAQAAARLTCRLPGEAPRARTVALPAQTEGTLLCEAMSNPGPDPIFQAALRIAGEMGGL